MAKRIEQLSDSLLDHYLVVSLLLALIILTQVGVGNIKIVSLLGLLLCAIGILQRNITVDLWIFIPLVLYTLIGTVSSWRVYGNICLPWGRWRPLNGTKWSFPPQDQWQYEFLPMDISGQCFPWRNYYHRISPFPKGALINNRTPSKTTADKNN